MSGIVQNNILRNSGTIAVTAAGLSWSTAVVTGSTVTVKAGNGYWINTTSNACTITLPSSAAAGDQIVLIDYVRTWGTNNVTLDQGSLKFQGGEKNPVYTTDGQSVNLIYSDSTKGWLPLEDDVVAKVPFPLLPQRAIFAFGQASGETYVSTSNLVNSSGVIAADVTGVGTVRHGTANAPFGTDKGIFRGGNDASNFLSVSNLVSNSGVVAADVSGVGTATSNGAGTGYGLDKGLIAFGDISGAVTNVSNLISNSGVVSANVTGVGTSRGKPGGTGYGGDKGILAYGFAGSSYLSMSNLVNTSGVVSSDVSGVGTIRNHMGASTYGTGLAIFAYGATTGTSMISISNKVSNVGVIAADVGSLAGTPRWALAAAGYGADKGVFAYGKPSGSITNVKNLLSNTGTMASDVTGVGTARNKPGAVTYSLSA